MEHESFEDETTADAPERAVRRDQGGSRGAARRRRDLHGRRPGDDRARRLADVGVPHARGRAVLRGHVLPGRPRHGMPSFRRCSRAIADAWTTRRDEVEVQSGRVIDVDRDAPGRWRPRAEPLAERIARRAFAAAAPTRSTHGGAGSAARRSSRSRWTLEFAAPAWRSGRSPDALEMVRLTLDRMAGGGMLRSGRRRLRAVLHRRALASCRTSRRCCTTTRSSRGCTRTRGSSTRQRDVPRVARETLDYLLREMRHPEGGFFTTQDADSEGVRASSSSGPGMSSSSLVGDEVAEAFGATPDGNWDGTNVLCAPPAGERRHRDECERGRSFERASRRGSRPRLRRQGPHGWNGLAIRAFAEAGASSTNPLRRSRRAAAQRSCGTTCGTGRTAAPLLARGGRRLRGFADDHALLAGVPLLYETTADVRWFVAARELCDTLLDRFADPERGGFFQTASDAETLVSDPRTSTTTRSRAGTRRLPRRSFGSPCSPARRGTRTRPWRPCGWFVTSCREHRAGSDRRCAPSTSTWARPTRSRSWGIRKPRTRRLSSTR